MNRRIFFVGVIFVLLVIQQAVAFKRRERIIVKAVKDRTYYAIVLSMIFFIMAFDSTKSFLMYDLMKGRSIIESEGFYFVVTQALLGLIWLLRCFDDEAIGEDGIYTKKGNYKWSRIIGYEWGIKEYAKSKRETVEFYHLKFRLKQTKKDTWFYGEVKREIGLNIPIANKEKADAFLRGVFGERTSER